MINCGELIVVYEGVYRHAMRPATFLSECAAVCGTDSSVVVACGGAARLWGFRRCAQLDLHVSGTGTGLRFIAGPVHHRCPTMPDHHVHVRGDGIRVTSPARTVFDLSKHLHASDVESIIEQGIRRSMFDIPELYAVGHLLCSRGRPGSARFAAVLSSRPAWRRSADSHPEIKLRKALSVIGVHLEPQVTLTLFDGQRFTRTSATQTSDSSSRSTITSGTADDSMQRTTGSVIGTRGSVPASSV